MKSPSLCLHPKNNDTNGPLPIWSFYCKNPLNGAKPVPAPMNITFSRSMTLASWKLECLISTRVYDGLFIKNLEHKPMPSILSTNSTCFLTKGEDAMVNILGAIGSLKCTNVSNVISMLYFSIKSMSVLKLVDNLLYSSVVLGELFYLKYYKLLEGSLAKCFNKLLVIGCCKSINVSINVLTLTGVTKLSFGFLSPSCWIS